MTLPPKLSAAFDAIYSGSAVLFTGAGFSRGAKNTLGNGPPDGASLATILTTACGISDAYPLNEAAEVYMEEYSESELSALIHEHYSIASVAAHHTTVAALPWRRIYTTNYDNLLEIAARSSNGSIGHVSLDTSPTEVDFHTHSCIHINGFVGDITSGMMPGSFKLTSSSYMQEAFQNSRWLSFFQNDLDLARAVFFVGYSLYDLDIARLVFQSEESHSRTYFVTSPTPTDRERRQLGRFGEVLPIGVQEFARILSGHEYSSPTPVADQLPSFRSTTSGVDTPVQVRDEDVLKLLLFGKHSSGLIAASIGSHGNGAPIVRREALDACWRHVYDNSKDLTLHSGVANGKTVLLEMLCQKAASAGVEVYELRRPQHDVQAEVERIVSRKARSLIVVENYEMHFRLLEHITTVRHDDVSLILTSRTSEHDVHQQRLYAQLDENNCIEVDCSTLGRQDLEAFVAILNRQGLWGQYASESEEAKYRRLERNCGAELRQILLHVLNSPDIRKRMEDLFRPLLNDNDATNAVALVMVLQLVLPSMSPNEILDLSGSDIYNQPSFRRIPVVSEIMDFSQGGVLARSSILAQFVLEHLVKPDNTLDVLVKLVHSADRHYFDGGSNDFNPFRVLWKGLMKYSVLQQLFPKRRGTQFVFQFYEKIRPLRRVQRHPHFWLQYAAARVTSQDYEIAGKHFDTAYSLAKAMDGYDTSYIDNHYARYLLAREMDEGGSDTCMQGFKKAARIIRLQLGDDANRHYPFRVAALAWPFFRRFHENMDERERRKIVSFANDVLGYAGRLSDRLKSHPSVRNCCRDMGKLKELEGRSHG